MRWENPSSMTQLVWFVKRALTVWHVTNITVMACMNASGKHIPPTFIIKGKTSKSLHGFSAKEAPPGSRWCFQNLNCAVFEPLKREYNKACSAYLSENPLNQVNEWTFPTVFREAWDTSV